MTEYEYTIRRAEQDEKDCAEELKRQAAEKAVEVAPIVRCKNCEYWNRTPENTTSFWKPCDEIKTEPNWHCWCGTPRKAQEESGGNRK